MKRKKAEYVECVDREVTSAFKRMWQIKEKVKKNMYEDARGKK